MPVNPVICIKLYKALGWNFALFLGRCGRCVRCGVSSQRPTAISPASAHKQRESWAGNWLNRWINNDHTLITGSLGQQIHSPSRCAVRQRAKMRPARRLAYTA